MLKFTHILPRILVLLLILQGPLAQAMLCADHVSNYDFDAARVLQDHPMQAGASKMGDCHTANTGVVPEVPSKSDTDPDAGQNSGDCCDAGCTCAATLNALVGDSIEQPASNIQPASIARIGEREVRVSVTIRPPIQ